MNRHSSKRIATALAIAVFATLMSGCGKSKSNESSTSPLPPGVLPPGGGYGPGYCVPINQQIPFASRPEIPVYITSNSVMADQVLIGGAPAIAGGTTYTRDGVDAFISLTISHPQTQYPYPGGYGGYGPAPTTGYGYGPSISGFIQVKPAKLQEMAYKYPGMYGYNGYGFPTFGQPGYGQPGYGQPGYGGYPQTQICVSGMQIDVGYTVFNGTPTIYNGWVYIQLNGGATHSMVEPLYF